MVLWDHGVNWVPLNLMLKSWLQYLSESERCLVVSDSLWSCGLYNPWNSPGQNTGMGSLSLLQGIFLTQGLNPGLLYCRQILYHLSHQGSPRILEWVACPFSSRSSRPRNQTGVSYIAGSFFTSWAIWKPTASQNVSLFGYRDLTKVIKLKWSLGGL